jgi:hypothetical protein
MTATKLAAWPSNSTLRDRKVSAPDVSPERKTLIKSKLINKAALMAVERVMR